MSKLVISGYYGFNNAGDETVLYAMVQTMRKLEPAMEITVLSHDPKHTEKLYGVKAVNRWRVLETAKALSSCDLLLSGGGSLLQDVTSSNSPLYYLGVIMLAKLLGKPAVIYAQGIGPIRKKRNRLLAAWVLNRVKLLTVRDQGSKDELQSMGVENAVTVTADPVLGLKGEDIGPGIGKEILAQNGVLPTGRERLLGVFIRSWENNAYLPELALSCDELSKRGWKIVFIPLHFPEDIAVSREAAGMMKAGSVVCRGGYRPEEFLSITKNLDMIIGMRLHALIYGAVAGVSLVGVSYDPKVERFLEQVGRQSLLTVQDLKSQVLVEMVDWASENQEELNKDTQKKVQVLFQKAWQTARLVEELLKEQRTL